MEHAILEHALRHRKLGSSTSHRQKMHGTNKEKRVAQHVRVNSNTRQMIQNQPDPNSDDDSELEKILSMDFNTSSPLPPSLPRIPPIEISTIDFFDTTIMAQKQENEDSTKLMFKSQSRPKMQATLTTMADWNYDRFSMLIDSLEVEEMLAEFTDDEPLPSSEEEEDESSDEYSPIEIATPVSYTLPKMKPSVISITNFHLHSPHLQRENMSHSRSMPRRHVSEQIIMGSMPDSIKSPAALFQVLNSSGDTLVTATDSSHVSRSVSLASQNTSSISRSVSQTSQSDQSGKSPKRKSSLPLLFGNNTKGHSRISSIKNFIRSSTSGAPPASPSYSSLQRQASGAALETHFESRNSSMDIPRSTTAEHPKRPTTAKVPASPLQTTNDLTSLSISDHVPDPIDATQCASPQQSETLTLKPVSKFHSRSGSFHTSKSSRSGLKTTETTLPPVPILITPAPPRTSGRSPSLAPSPRSPHDPRRGTGSYSPFPGTDRRTSSMNIGLGLRL